MFSVRCYKCPVFIGISTHVCRHKHTFILLAIFQVHLGYCLPVRGRFGCFYRPFVKLNAGNVLQTYADDLDALKMW